MSINPSDETLFAGALELPPEKRAAFLERACAGDAARRARIDGLLRADNAPGFMAVPAAELAVTARGTAPPEEVTGARIGRYKLLQKIGEGGCGIVYMAEQEEPVRRRVALKVIKLGMDTREVIARFEAERQALALMDHPNIARVFDGGATEAGRPFFVMELVRGIPITKYCDEQNLPTVARLELFTQVCHAVQHAHQKGIIHRDIKPSNILVTLHDGKPVPKVIDFGIAKATQGRLTDRTLFTAFEQFIGTPAYMSPEQAEMSGLDIDTRSDIYSLGVLLYELLTGRPPFDPKTLVAAGLDEIRRIIREIDPPRMSTRLSTLTDIDRATIARNRSILPAQLSTLLRGDLDWIVMKALEKNRTRRYETANGLALDVLRHLHDEPVVARPPNAAYRLRKLVRRNKLFVGSSVAVGLALVAGLVVAMWRYQREKVARIAETTARVSETAARTLAEQRETELEIINRFLVTDMLGSAAPQVAQGREITVKQVLDNAAARVATSFAGNPLLEATLRATIGETYRRIGALSLAEPHIRAVLEIRGRLLGAEHPDTLAARHALGRLHHDALRLDEAETTLRQVCEARTRHLGANHEHTLDSANDLVSALGANGKFGDAYELARQTCDLARRHLAPDSRVALTALKRLAGQAGNNGRWAEAVEHYAPLLERLRQVLGPEHPDVIETIHDAGWTLTAAGRFNEAEALLREGLELTQRVFGPTHLNRPQLQFRLVDALRRQGKFSEADQLTSEALDSARKAGGATLENAEVLVWGRWNWLSQQNRAEEAAALAREWVEIFRQAKINPRDFSSSLEWLGRSLIQLSRHAEAETPLREAIAVRETRTPEDYRRFNTQRYLGAALRAQGKFTEAETLLLGAYRGLKENEANIHTSHRNSIFQTLDELVALYRAWSRLDKVTEWQRQLQGEAKHAATSRKYWHTIGSRATDHRMAKRFDEAIALRTELLTAQKAQLGPEHRDALQTLEYLGFDYLLAGQPVRAGELFRAALQAWEKNLPDDWARFAAMRLLGDALLAQNKFSEAEPLLVAAREGLFARADKIPASTRPQQLRNILTAGIRLYESWGKPSEAAEWRQARADFDRVTPQKR